MADLRRRILLVSPFAPGVDGRHGSARAVHSLASALAERHELVLIHLDAEHDVDPQIMARCLHVERLVLPERTGWSRRATDALSLVRGRPLWVADSAIARLRRRVAALVERYEPDVVQVEHAVLGDALDAAGPLRLRVQRIVDPAASQSQYWKARSGIALVHRIDARAAVRHERRVLALADAAVVFTERDRAVVAPHVQAHTQLVTIPLGIPVPDRPLNPTGSYPATLLFVGNFMHPPNVDAALRVAGQILPLVHATCPEVRLEIVGPSPPAVVRALESTHVRVTGAVSSVIPHLDRAAVVLAPMAIGGGIRVKVLEALAAGKAVVASSLASEGIPAGNEKCLVIADTDDDAAAAISRLLRNDEGRRQLAGRARAWAVRELALSTMGDRFDDLYGLLETRLKSECAARHRTNRG